MITMHACMTLMYEHPATITYMCMAQALQIPSPAPPIPLREAMAAFSGDSTCAVCNQGDTGEAAHTFPCGHALHTACLESYKDALLGYSYLECPVCRLDAAREQILIESDHDPEAAPGNAPMSVEPVAAPDEDAMTTPDVDAVAAPAVEAVAEPDVEAVAGVEPIATGSSWLRELAKGAAKGKNRPKAKATPKAAAAKGIGKRLANADDEVAEVVKSTGKRHAKGTGASKRTGKRLAKGTGKRPEIAAAEEPAEELAEEPVEEPAEELAEEPAEEPAEELAEEPAEEPAEELAEEPAEEPAEESALPAPSAEVPPETQLAKPQLFANPHAEFQRMAVPFPKMAKEPTLFCNWCDLPVEASRTRITAKQGGKCKCNRCSSTFTKMYSHHGKWPTAEFNTLSADAQTDFYAKAAKMSKSQQIVELMEHKLEKFQSRDFTWALGGQFLPLNVWATQGYDSERIARTTKDEDIQENEQVGTCYRVRLYSTIERGSEGWKSSQTLLSRSGDVNRIAPAAASASSQALPPSETKAEFAERLKLEKTKRQEVEKAATKKKLMATQLVKKLAAPLERLTKTLASDGAGHISASVKQGALTLRDQGTQLQKELNAVIDTPDGSDDPSRNQEVRT